MDIPQTPFTAHNIRLDDGSLTIPAEDETMAERPQMQAIARMLRVVFPGGLRGKSVIDIGCLEGGYTVELARLGMDATGLEVRDSNFANCCYVKDRVRLPNLHFIQADANDVDQHGMFDVFFVNGLLYHLDAPAAFLAKVATKCRKMLFLNTHVAFRHPTEGARFYKLSEVAENEGLSGRWYFEHDGPGRDQLNAMKWASWNNRRSFWVQKEHLLGLLQQLGFDIVVEQFDWMGKIGTQMTQDVYTGHDRVTIVGIKSA